MLPKDDINLRKLSFSPNINPLLSLNDVHLKQKKVRTGASVELVDTKTGEVMTSVIHQTKVIDEEHFVKVFAEGIKAAYDLNLTGYRVFQGILAVYQEAPMAGGFVDSVYLNFMDGQLSGSSIGISEAQFYRGMKILLQKGFLAPRAPNLYWVNPHLFFRGDRAMFILEYRKEKKAKDIAEQNKLGG
jgi:hypothetical protein